MMAFSAGRCIGLASPRLAWQILGWAIPDQRSLAGRKNKFLIFLARLLTSILRGGLISGPVSRDASCSCRTPVLQSVAEFNLLAFNLMRLARAISGCVEPIWRRWVPHALLGVGVGIAVAIAALVSLSVGSAAGSRSHATWLRHHQECHNLPEELYHRDRFRAIRGRVGDEDGKPVAGAVVRCVKLESLVELAKAGAPSPLTWSVPIEAETKTDENGRYEFPHLPVGGRTFFYSAPGRELAPAIKDLVVVQDGLGAQLDVTLARPAVLRVKVTAARVPSLLVKGAGRGTRRSARGERPARLHIIPQRWWPDLITAAIPEGRDSVEFWGLGGPLRKGLIAASGADQHAPLWVVGRYDLDESTETVISRGAKGIASRFDLPEAAGIQPWPARMRASHRLFYAAMSPIAMFWPVVGDDQPLWLTEPAHPLRTPPPSKICHGGNEHGSRFCAAPVSAGAGGVAYRGRLAGVDERCVGV